MNGIYKKDFIFTSEYVSRGHPDKIADQISDFVLDFLLVKFKPEKVKIAIETLIINNIIKIAGEVSRALSKDELNELRISISNFLKNDRLLGRYFVLKEPDIEIILNLQSSDINSLVDNSYINNDGDFKDDIGAGDQGMMFGFACNDTENFMPAPIFFAKLVIDSVLNNDDYKEEGGLISKLGPDAKSQVTVEYKNGKPFKIQKILLSIGHPEEIKFNEVYDIVIESILKKIPVELIDQNTQVMVNPAGKFVINGPFSDTGVTGRKIIVDTYGGFAPHGGGAFSGKDPTKVDRSGAYMTRYIAKNLVASGICEKCLVCVSYAIGMSEAFSFSVETFGTLNCDLVNIGFSDEIVTKYVKNIFDLRPQKIIEKFDLWNLKFLELSMNGHFGSKNLPFEKLDSMYEIKNKFFLKIKECL